MKASRSNPFSLAGSLLSGFPEDGSLLSVSVSVATGVFRDESGIL